MANTTWSATDKTAGVTLTGSNLIATASGAANGVRAADRQITGKFYWENTLTTASATYGTGAALAAATLSSLYAAPVGAIILYGSGAIWINNVNSSLTLGSLAAGGVVVCHALDLTNSSYWARSGAAGNWNGMGHANPATGSGGLNFSAIFGSAFPFYPAAAFGIAAATTANFGDSAFTGTVPSGFTSGFTSAATPANSVVATQIAIEEWASVANAVPVTSTIGAMVLA